MSDISSFWNIDEMHADWQENFGVLTSGNDMHTAVLISLFTDGLARADDPYEGTDRRGWWSDLDNDKPIGSRLWLLRREKLTVTLPCAEQYAEEALAWMKNDGIARDIQATSEIIFLPG
jgi:phage gp46-like protein